MILPSWNQNQKCQNITTYQSLCKSFIYKSMSFNQLTKHLTSQFRHNQADLQQNNRRQKNTGLSSCSQRKVKRKVTLKRTNLNSVSHSKCSNKGKNEESSVLATRSPLIFSMNLALQVVMGAMPAIVTSTDVAFKQSMIRYLQHLRKMGEYLAQALLK